MSFIPALRPAVSLLLLLAACAAPARRPAARSVPAGPLAAAESLYLDLRSLGDRIDVARAAGHPEPALVTPYDRLRHELADRLAGIDSADLGSQDRRALAVMRTTLAGSVPSAAAPSPGPPDCDYDADGIASAPGGLDSLRARMYACYGWAQARVRVGADTLDRLTILGALGRTEDSARRRELLLALEPVWRTMEAYGTLIAAEVAARGDAEPAAARQALAAGVPPDSLERWLLGILETWRDAGADTLIEPWDWYYQNGRAGRALSPRIPRARLTELNREVYRSLGVDLAALEVRYDLEPRLGKTPVAFTTFGGRAPIEPWVFATYRTGGLDNLNELLHESGHAAHIAAIRTRPAFADWPDSDPFTEAVADFVALEVYEPAWQQRWLGDSVPLAEGLRARYGGIVLDVAWALFEVRMQREPGADPNRVWSELTSEYLGIRPHPELAWWAMRGQLVDAPGYMMNYAVGAILIAAIRDRTREAHGPFVTGDPSWYGWVAPRLFRYGLERPAHEVVEEFLGGSVSPSALVEDMRRMGVVTRSTR